MKSIVIGLITLLMVLQYQLWFAEGSLLSALKQQRNIEKQKTINLQFSQYNRRLKTNITHLKHNKAVIEAHARNDLGMIKKDETFYQIIKHDSNDTP